MSSIEYTLVRRSRSIEFVESLERAFKKINNSWSSNADCSRDQMEEWWVAVNYIDICLNYNYTKRKESFKKWRRDTDLDTLSYNEALCLLLGIPTDHTDDFILIDLSKYKTESDIDKCSIEIEFYKTRENNFLKRKYNGNSINTQEFIEWAIDKKFVEKIIIHSEGVEHRQSTIELQQIINSIARKMMNKHPTTPKYVLGDEIELILNRNYKISKKSSTIRTEYLKNHPNY